MRNTEADWYRVTNRCLLALAAIYVMIAVWTELVPGREEAFPFGAWSLFTLVPGETRDYSLRVTQVDGHDLPKPVYFEDAEKFTWAAEDHAARVVIQKLGRAIETGDDAQARVLRERIESGFFPDHSSLAYEVVRRRFDGLARWKRGEFREETTLRRYRMERGR